MQSKHIVTPVLLSSLQQVCLKVREPLTLRRCRQLRITTPNKPLTTLLRPVQPWRRTMSLRISLSKARHTISPSPCASLRSGTVVFYKFLAVTFFLFLLLRFCTRSNLDSRRCHHFEQGYQLALHMWHPPLARPVLRTREYVLISATDRLESVRDGRGHPARSQHQRIREPDDRHHSCDRAFVGRELG